MVTELRLALLQLSWQGKSLFMPLRVLLTGKLHGPDMGSSVILIYKAGNHGVVAPQAGFLTLRETFETLRQLDWEALNQRSACFGVCGYHIKLKMEVLFKFLQSNSLFGFSFALSKPLMRCSSMF